MSTEERDIKSILFFRNDISPFLVHLTRTIDAEHDAKTNLHSILTAKELRYGNNHFSDARFGYDVSELTSEIERRYFSAVSFTETPLNEIHNLLEIMNRKVDLQPYGIVFRKDYLKYKGVSPVIYLNNISDDKNALVQVLCGLIASNPTEAEKILPYISVFGKTLMPVGGTPPNREIDFTWEREWRYASNEFLFRFEPADIFIGLCPHKDIEYFEREFGDEFGLLQDDIFHKLQFIDPRRNTKWYAEKLISARHRSDIDYSVV